jgi:hypothetical protein
VPSFERRCAWEIVAAVTAIMVFPPHYQASDFDRRLRGLRSIISFPLRAARAPASTGLNHREGSIAYTRPSTQPGVAVQKTRQRPGGSYYSFDHRILSLINYGGAGRICVGLDRRRIEG